LPIALLGNARTPEVVDFMETAWELQRPVLTDDSAAKGQKVENYFRQFEYDVRLNRSYFLWIATARGLPVSPCPLDTGLPLPTSLN
jgi:hypothetical protein